MFLTYHLFNDYYRSIVNLRKYQECLEYAIGFFPMVKLIEVTRNDFTIRVNASSDGSKNGVVRMLGRRLAGYTDLCNFVVYKYGKSKLFIEKK